MCRLAVHRACTYALTLVLLALGGGAARADDRGSPDAGVAAVGSDGGHHEEAPMRDDAKAYLERGVSLYSSKDYAGAIAAFKGGYALEPRRVFLFAWAQAARLSGDCASAVELYEKFLAEGPEEAERAAAQQNLVRCQEALQAEVAPPPEPPAPAPALPPTVPPRTITVRDPWYRDVTGNILLGAGVVSAGAGIAFLWVSNSARDAADNASTYREYQSAIARARERRTISLIGMTVGAGLIVSGVVRYMLRADREVVVKPTGATVTPLSTVAGGLGLGLEGVF